MKSRRARDAFADILPVPLCRAFASDRCARSSQGSPVEMLDNYDLRMLGFQEGAGHLKIPADHPAYAELEEAGAKPVGALHGEPDVFLFTIDEWHRIAARQRSPDRRT
jgi:hypothetical protein